MLPAKACPCVLPLAQANTALQDFLASRELAAQAILRADEALAEKEKRMESARGRGTA